MASDGILGRLDFEDFKELITGSLLLPATLKMLEEQSNNLRYLDVRLPLECSHAPRKGCINMPVSLLRKNLHNFVANKVYIVTPEGGRRSDLATYLLRQAGLEAYCLDKETDLLFQVEHRTVEKQAQNIV